jgi:hypothetical protein
LKGCGPSAKACQKAFSRFTSSGVGTLSSSSLSVMSPQSTRRKPYQTSTPRGPNGSARRLGLSMPVCWALLAGPRPGSSALRMNTKAVPVVVAGIAVITGLLLTLLLAGGRSWFVRIRGGGCRTGVGTLDRVSARNARTPRPELGAFRRRISLVEPPVHDPPPPNRMAGLVLFRTARTACPSSRRTAGSTPR